MTFRFKVHEGVPAAICRIARQELRGCITDLQEQQPNLHEAVHDFRKRCKKLRGLIRLVGVHLGADYEIFNQVLRDQARELSFLRDLQAQLEALSRLEGTQEETSPARQLSHLKDFLISVRDQAVEDQASLDAHIEAVKRQMKLLYRRVAQWQIPDEGFDAIRVGLMNTYRRARKAMQAAEVDPTDHHFHEWRKDVKYHWHHASLFVSMQPRLMRPHIQLADELAEFLGQDHDYAVLRQRLVAADGDPTFREERQAALDALQAQQQIVRKRSAQLGANLHAESPRHLAKRWHAYWRTWQQSD